MLARSPVARRSLALSRYGALDNHLVEVVADVVLERRSHPPGRERPEPEAATAPKAAAVGQTGASALGGASLKRSRHSAQSLAPIAAPARRPPRERQFSVQASSSLS